VALEDALDIGDAQRNGKSKIDIRDATGAVIDRFTLSIKAAIWREENKRRAERTKMGKIATLQQGRWPGHFAAFGYTARKAEGRGRVITIVEDEAVWVRQIHHWFDAGVSVPEIRRRFIAEGVEQKNNTKHDWALSIVYSIIQAEYYTGRLVWRFGDGTEYAIEIPPIISRELWERNQTRIGRNKQLSTRNAKGVYLLQGLVYCGDCGRAMEVRCRRWYYQNGERRQRKSPSCIYRCVSPGLYPEEPHPRPYNRGVKRLDWQVWRHIVDSGIKRPDLIREQVQARQAELQAEGENANSEIAHARHRLTEVDQERAFYQRQAARGKMTEREFDTRMEETEEIQRYWEAELERLQDLRDDTAKVQDGLDYATELLNALQEQLPDIDLAPNELRTLPEDKQNEVLRVRRSVIRALCERIHLYADGRVKIEGVLDGSEAAQFDLATRYSS
jgi:hypothetical protein